MALRAEYEIHPLGPHEDKFRSFTIDEIKVMMLTNHDHSQSFLWFTDRDTDASLEHNPGELLNNWTKEPVVIEWDCHRKRKSKISTVVKVPNSARDMLIFVATIYNYRPRQSK